MKWQVLGVGIGAEETMRLYNEGLLVRDVARQGHRLYGQLDFMSKEHTWFGTSTIPIGIDEWTNLVLARIYCLRTGGVCGECGQEDMCFATSGAPSRQGFCPRCWLRLHEHRSSSRGSSD